jgi:4'-phosphopantetheinyl transferase
MPELAELRDRYAPGRRRTQALASRVLVRAVLGRATGLAHRVSIVTDSAGRPRLAGPPPQPHFNVSHGTGLLALVLGTGPCGIDVEDAPESELREVAYRFCGVEDQDLLAVPGGARRLWAAKESVTKALGHGLRAGLSSIHFTDDPGGRWAGVTWRGSGVGLRTRTVDLADSHLAVTADAEPRAVHLTRWEPRCADGRWGLRPAPPDGTTPRDIDFGCVTHKGASDGRTHSAHRA